MTKYSLEFKLIVVDAYLGGSGGYKYVAKQFGVKSKSQIHHWVNCYSEKGVDGLSNPKGRPPSMPKKKRLKEGGSEYEHYYPNAQAIKDAQVQVIKVTDNCPVRRIFHSDQGRAHQMASYSHRLKEHHIFQNMSRKGNCLDNSLM